MKAPSRVTLLMIVKQKVVLMATLLPILFVVHFVFPASSVAQIDLHNHLDMKPGIGLLLQGRFNEEPQSKEWTSRHETKATLKSFEGSTPLSPLIVISLYAHPLLAYTETFNSSLFKPKNLVDEALDEEYREVMAWVNAHSENFGVARNAAEAEKLISSRKTALVFSLEGAFGALESETGFKKWIDERGVAIVTPFHLTEDHFSGAALLPGYRGINSPFEFFKSLLISGFSCLKTFCKGTIGISGEGMGLIDKLMKRKVWIDVAHSNELDLQELLPLLAQSKLPLLATHTQLREFYQAERGLGQAEIQYIKENDGIIGLVPSQDFMTAKLVSENTVDPCYSSLDAFKNSLAFAAKELGSEKIALGSDINAPLNGLSPTCLTININAQAISKSGFYSYSQWPELARFVAPLPLTPDEWNKKVLAHFLTLWKRVR